MSQVPSAIQWGEAVPVRSALFVPGNRRSWIEKASGYGADSLVLDLEDAVPPDQKEEARQILSETIPLLRERGQPVWVRVNGIETEHLLADLEAVCVPGASVICLPKTRSVDDVVELDRLITYREGGTSQALGTIGILPALETATGLLDAAAIFGASPRVRYAGGMVARGADVEFALGSRWTDTFEESLAFRSLTLVAARAKGIENPITGLVTDLDEAVLRRFAEQSRSIGYTGMFVIHPSQVPVVNEVFSPTEQEVAWSQEVLEIFTAALDEGRAAIRDSQGRMIDIAMVRTAERIAARHRLFEERARRRNDARA